jgi:hypothetical protein
LLFMFLDVFPTLARLHMLSRCDSAAAVLAGSLSGNCDRRAETSFTDAWYRFFEGLITRAWNRRLQSCQDERRLMHPIHHLFFFTQGGSK